MYTLVSGLWRYMFQRDEFYILILGLDNAGKTTFLEQLKTKFTKDYKMMNPAKITTTVGLNIGKIDIGRVRLKFWDLGGQEELQALWDKYYAESHGVIYVIDSSDRERLEESWIAFDKMLQSEHLENVPLLVVANKQDLNECLSVKEIKTVWNRSSAQIGSRHCMALPISALQGDGVQESIEWMTRCVQENLLRRPPVHERIT